MNPNDAIPDISEVQKHINLSEKQVAFLEKLNAESVTAAKAEHKFMGELISSAKAAIRVLVRKTGEIPDDFELRFTHTAEDGTRNWVNVGPMSGGKSAFVD